MLAEGELKSILRKYLEKNPNVDFQPDHLATFITWHTFEVFKGGPKPVTLLAACHVLETAIVKHGYRLDLRVKNFSEFKLADLLIHFAHECEG